jgi:hypothetical protein
MYLCNQDRFSLLETLTKFFILGRKLLAVAAPRVTEEDPESVTNWQ